MLFYFLICILLFFSLVIRGEHNDDAVLCTSSRTYDLKEAQSSNSLLLCPSLKYPKDKGILLIVH